MTMATKPETIDDDSFIILGTSPGTSLDLNCDVSGPGPSLDPTALDDAMKELSNEASMAFKAYFKLGDGPSPASLMVASNIITDDKSTEELQKQFGEILDENVILKETLQKNNDSMKEQFLMIASCQEDMMKTHMLHKEKFDETRELVEKLRQENKKLKLDVARLMDDPRTSVKSAASSGPPSALEFVTSPDDDTIDKLTTQLELVEKQRRQVIVDNEKLTWQKESLEHLLDATSKERDDLKDKVKNVELQLATVENDTTQKIKWLNIYVQNLQKKLESEKNTVNNLQKNTAEVEARFGSLKKANAKKITALQTELRLAQVKICDFESLKLDFSKYKSDALIDYKLHQDQVQELRKKLKEAQTTVFQPVRVSVSTESEPTSGEYASFKANVKVYDKTLKHLAELLNLITHGSVDSLVHCIGVVTSLSDERLERGAELRAALGALRDLLEKQHSAALNNIGQVKGIMSIFEGMFKDYNQLLKKRSTRQDNTPLNAGVEQLTAALVARGHEVQSLQAEVLALRTDAEDRQVLAAQLDLYKSDFEAEREAREKMASEKDNILKDLRTAQRRVQELTEQLDEQRKQGANPQPTPFRAQSAGTGPKPTAGPKAPGPKTATGTRRQSTPASTSGNMVYTCPKCLRFSSSEYSTMEDHFDDCLDDF